MVKEGYAIFSIIMIEGNVKGRCLCNNDIKLCPTINSIHAGVQNHCFSGGIYVDCRWQKNI